MKTLPGLCPIAWRPSLDSEFAAATFMITFDAIIGRASPWQLIIICISQSFFLCVQQGYSCPWIDRRRRCRRIHDHSHVWRYFGLAVSYALGAPKDVGAEASMMPDKVSDIMALIGTTILWLGELNNEQHYVINTILSLMASTTVTFYLSQKFNHGKFDPVHIANSTLAGGVAIGSAARLNIGPGYAVVTGVLAGTAIIYGYVYSSPMLESKFDIFDTCGVGNLHGYPSLVGALLSVAFIALDSEADFLRDSMGSQMLRQLGRGILSTFVINIVSGYGTGLFISAFKGGATLTFKDSVWWHLEY